MSSSPENIILTTGFEIAGHETLREIDVITAECAYGMNFMRDFFAAVRDVVGGRSESVQDVLRDARETVLNELRVEAARRGADGVIGIDLDYHELSGGGKNGMLLVVACGTAVQLQKLTS